MLKKRLVWILEAENRLSIFQCGFRERHSTLDHIVRLESFIVDSFIYKQSILAVSFDINEAFDKVRQEKRTLNIMNGVFEENHLNS